LLLTGLFLGLLHGPARSPVLLGVAMFRSSLFTRPLGFTIVCSGLSSYGRPYCTALVRLGKLWVMDYEL